jgi:hypothetical protein
MTRLSYLSIGEIAEHLSMLTVQCDRCGRRGRYNTAQLLAKYGAAATVQPFQDDLSWIPLRQVRADDA